jgi:non-specific serine/threonine protein kinase
VTRIAIEEATVLLRDGGDGARARAQDLLESAARAAAEMELPRHTQRVEALRKQLVPTLPSPPPPSFSGAAGAASLRRVGDVWTITSDDRSIHLNDGRGVRLLALLLERPGTEVHSLDLVAAVDGVTVRQVPIEHSGGQETSGSFGVQGGAGPALDAKAKDEYRLRMAAVETQLAAAEARRDERAAAAARKELEFVRSELSTAVGIGGRDRETGSHSERARINVTRAIRSTLKRIAGYDARIGAELEAGVKTGTFCVYQPDPLRPLVWIVEHG